MKKFAIGFLTGAILFTLCVLGYLKLGLASVAADAPPSAWTTRWVDSSVHAAFRRTVPATLKSSLPANDENLIAGGKLYLNNCVGCHGAPGQPPSDFGVTFYPRAPQLARDGTSYSEAEIFWITKHGIRRSGMSAQRFDYTDDQLWQLAGFVSHITTLPPRVRAGLEQGSGH